MRKILSDDLYEMLKLPSYYEVFCYGYKVGEIHNNPTKDEIINFVRDYGYGDLSDDEVEESIKGLTPKLTTNVTGEGIEVVLLSLYSKIGKEVRERYTRQVYKEIDSIFKELDIPEGTVIQEPKIYNGNNGVILLLCGIHSVIKVEEEIPYHVRRSLAYHFRRKGLPVESGNE